MEELGQTELWLNGIVELSPAQPLACLSTPAGGVAALYHEVLDDPMKEQRVVELGAHQFQEVVTMFGRLVEQRNADIALCGFQQYLGPLLLSPSALRQAAEQAHHEKKSFHISHHSIFYAKSFHAAKVRNSFEKNKGLLPKSSTVDMISV
jgi:hypothetical protein